MFLFVTYTRVHDLDQRVDAFELRVAENYVSKESFQTALERVEAHMIRIENNRQFSKMITLIKPILFAFLKSDSVTKAYRSSLLPLLKKLIMTLMTLQWLLFRLHSRLNEKESNRRPVNELHNLVTKEFLARIKSSEVTTQDLKAACDWLKTNDIMELHSKVTLR